MGAAKTCKFVVTTMLTATSWNSLFIRAMKKLILSIVLAAFALGAVAPSVEAAPVVRRAFAPALGKAKPKKKKKHHHKKKRRHGKRKL